MFFTHIFSTSIPSFRPRTLIIRFENAMIGRYPASRELNGIKGYDLMLKKEFLERFSISEDEFREAGLDWDDLCYIAKDYARKLPELQRIRDEFLQEFIKNKDQRTGLHSYRTRVKTPWHLVEKKIGRATSELQSRFDLVCRLLLE